MLSRITQLFPVWAVLFSALAFFNPEPFSGLRFLIVPALIVIMLSMGLTLRVKDFLNVATRSGAVAIGVFLQFSVMPVVALLISILLDFNAELTLGMVLVGSVAGGTASNVMCFLAKGDVALSITMTAVSTLSGVILTPFLVELLAGQVVDIPLTAMMLNLLKIVFVPVVIGLLINHFFQSAVHKLTPVLPFISMLTIVGIIAVIVALNADKLAEMGPVVLMAVILHNSIGLLSGYLVPRQLGFDESVCRTIAFEVGLQNSGLAVALAMKFFAPAAAIAGSIFSIWHNVSGSVLATYWNKRSKQQSESN